jgi:hypothetical protein
LLTTFFVIVTVGGLYSEIAHWPQDHAKDKNCWRRRRRRREEEERGLRLAYQSDASRKAWRGRRGEEEAGAAAG